MYNCSIDVMGWGVNFFAAIRRFAKFTKLTYHHKFLCFAAKCSEFDYFCTMVAKYQHKSVKDSVNIYCKQLYQLC